MTSENREKHRDSDVAAVCGRDPTGTFPDGRMGCGEPIAACAEIYRCVDCTTPFHRDCACKHFESHRERLNATMLAYQVTLAQDHVGADETQDPKVQVAFTTIASRFLDHWRDLLMTRDPVSATGPLSSLLSDVAHETRKMCV